VIFIREIFVLVRTLTKFGSGERGAECDNARKSRLRRFYWGGGGRIKLNTEQFPKVPVLLHVDSLLRERVYRAVA
jgi:hypothetical protein